jgi:hypothetical protein
MTTELMFDAHEDWACGRICIVGKTLIANNHGISVHYDMSVTQARALALALLNAADKYDKLEEGLEKVTE